MPTSDFEIRLGGRADLPCMAAMADAFRRTLGRESPTKTEFVDRIESLLDDPDTDFLVAYDGANDGDGHCAGYLQQRYRRNIWTVGDEAYIEDVFVAERSRQLGLGTRLVETAMDTLDTNERNVRAVAVYQRLGFTNSSGPDSEIGGGRQLWFERTL